MNNHTTHYACKEQLEKNGRDAVCCYCTGHNCADDTTTTTPTNREADNWEKRFDEKFPQCNCNDCVYIEELNDLDRFLEPLPTRKAIKKFIRQTHLDLLREVEREVIGEDDKIKPTDLVDLVGLQKKTVNRFRKEQRTKLSHIITRVEKGQDAKV